MEDWKGNINRILMTGMAVTIMILLLTKGCGNKCPEQKEVVTYQETHVFDTIKVHDTVIVMPKRKVPKPSSSIPSAGKDTSIAKVINEYNDSSSVSDATVYYKAKTIGILQSIDLSVKLKNRVIIKETETITKTVEKEVVKNPKFYLSPIIGLSGNKTQFGISGGLVLGFNKNTIEAQYDPLNQRISIGISRVLFKSRK